MINCKKKKSSLLAENCVHHVHQFISINMNVVTDTNEMNTEEICDISLTEMTQLADFKKD